MALRRVAVLTTVALMAGLVAGVSAPASAYHGDGPPCSVVSVTRNGESLPTTWVLLSAAENCPLIHGTKNVSWTMLNGPGPGEDTTPETPTTEELGPDSHQDTYSVTIDVGTPGRPRTTGTTGSGVTVTRKLGENGHWTVTITGKPVRSAYGSVGYPRVPLKRPEQQFEGVFFGAISNDAYGYTKAQAKALDGLDLSGDIEDQSFPPAIKKDGRGAFLQMRMFNSPYLKKPRTTVFKGSAGLVVPDAFLRAVYGVDPAKLTPASFRFVLTGKGGGRMTATDLGTSWRFDLTKVKFPETTWRKFQLLVRR